MQLIYSLIAAGALGTLAHPSGHNHRHVHPQRDVEVVHDVVTVFVTEQWPPQTTPSNSASTSSTNNGPPTTTPTNSPSSSTTTNIPYLPTTTNRPPGLPTTTTPVSVEPPHASASSASSAPAAASTSSSSNPPDGSSGMIPFCDGKAKRATLAEITKQGNLGSTYGCNIMTVPESIAHLYSYTATFKNVDKMPYQVICANKIGRNGGVNGFFKGSESVVFKLDPGSSQVVAMEANSLGACFFGENSVPVSSDGLYLGTWFEFSYADSSNNGWSGADCSSLTALNNNGKVYGCNVCQPGAHTECSTILPSSNHGSSFGTNAFSTKESATADGLGLKIPPSANGVRLAVEVGYGSA